MKQWTRSYKKKEHSEDKKELLEIKIMMADMKNKDSKIKLAHLTESWKRGQINAK